MQSSQSDILSQCLTLIERGQITPAQCVARYPEFKDLAELLDAALTVRVLPLVRLDSARRQVIRQRMMAQYQATRAAYQQTRPTDRPAARRNWALRALVSAFMVIALLFAGSAGLVQAASNTVPGDSLYGLKRAVEGLQLSFASSDARIIVLNNIAQTRLDEVRTLVNRGQPLADAVLEDTVSSIQTALAVQPSMNSRNDLLGETSDAIHFAEALGAISPARGESLLNTLTADQTTLDDGSPTPPGLNAKPTKSGRGPKQTKIPGDDGNSNGNSNGGNNGRGNNGR